MEESPVVGLTEASRQTGIQRTQILRWVEQGRLEAVEVRPYGKRGQPVYRLSDIQALAATRRRGRPAT